MNRPVGRAGRTEANAEATAAATLRAPARVTEIGSPEIRLASPTYASKSKPATAPSVKIPAASASAAARCPTGRGATLR